MRKGWTKWLCVAHLITNCQRCFRFIPIHSKTNKPLILHGTIFQKVTYSLVFRTKSLNHPVFLYLETWKSKHKKKQHSNIYFSPNSHCSWLSPTSSMCNVSVHCFFCFFCYCNVTFCHLALGVPCLQNLTTANAHTKDQDGDLSKLSKDGEHGKARAPSEAQSNIFVLRKMVEEVFTVLYSKEGPS